MSFLKRLGYYLGGLSFGIIFVFFFFNGKRTQCNYSPSDRVLNDIKKKEWVFDENFYKINDTIKWFSKSKINFNNSIIGTDSCNIYLMSFTESIYYIKNCDETAYFSR
jgi:hypothetical protein